MSQTPRTDAASRTCLWIGAGPSRTEFLGVPSDLAGNLEIELNEVLKAFRHRHENNGINDVCRRCGLDLRHEIHERAAAEVVMNRKLRDEPEELAKRMARRILRRLAIIEVKSICAEALDHETYWPVFCDLVQARLEIETAAMLTALLEDKND